jgi:hypothetical protein
MWETHKEEIEAWQAKFNFKSDPSRAFSAIRNRLPNQEFINDHQLWSKCIALLNEAKLKRRNSLQKNKSEVESTKKQRTEPPMEKVITKNEKHQGLELLVVDRTKVFGLLETICDNFEGCKQLQGKINELFKELIEIKKQLVN